MRSPGTSSPWRYTIIGVVITIVLLLPLYWVLSGSFMTPRELFGVHFSIWPHEFVFQNWSNALQRLATIVLQKSLKEGFGLNPIGIASKNQRAILQERQNVIGGPVIVRQEVAFRVARLGKKDFFKMGQAELLSFQIDDDFRALTLK